MKDLMLLRYLAGTTPYKAGYGKTADAWESVCNDLKTRCFDEKGNQVFSSSLTVRLIKDRFKEYIGFIKRYNSQVPFRSGNDDEETYEILQLAEQIFEDYTSYELEKDNKKAAENSKVQADLAAAAELRSASLGKYKRKTININSSDSDDSSKDSTKKKVASKEKRREQTKEKENLVYGYNALREESAIREERMKLKEENRKELIKVRAKEVANREKEIRLLEYVVGMMGKKKKRKHSDHESENSNGSSCSDASTSS
jgi:hypothetical protein